MSPRVVEPRSLTVQRIRLRVDVLLDIAKDVRTAGEPDLARSIENVARDIGHPLERLSSV